MPTEDNIRSLRGGLPDWALEVLLRGNPREIGMAGIRGVDADAAMTPDQIAAVEAAGFKSPGVPMTVTQLAQAMLAGVIPPDTRIADAG